MSNIQLNFTVEGVNLVLTALSELPAKHTRKLLNDIEMQLAPYTQPQETQEPYEEVKPEPAPQPRKR
jgi:hypothetical protein